MGLMRRVESRVEDAVGGPGRARSDKGSTRKGSKLYVQPAELARKLVKELEDHRVFQSTRVLACNRYTVFLCPADHQRLRVRQDEMLAGLERHLAKHVRAKKYEIPGDIVVTMVMDPDLTPGHFGILAERVGPARVERRGPGPSTRTPASTATAAFSSAAGTVAHIRQEAVRNGGGATKVIRPGEAEQLDLAHDTIILKAGNRVREFSHGRVIVGRARDADFRVDDPNVSRRHVAIYWAEGDIMAEDLDSTNGTSINGHPVTSAVVRPGDVLVVGDCRITVETR